MPNYTYTSASDDGCRRCSGTFTVYERFLAERLRECPECSAPIRIVIRNQSQTVIKAKHRAGFKDYREDLARFPGDPQAYVNSPEQVDRLVEQRKREGWRVRDEDWGDMASTMPSGSLEAAPEITKEETEALVDQAFADAMDELNP